MASVHSRRSTDIRVNLTLTSSDASRGGHVTKAPTPSHVVPRRRAPIRAQVIEIPPAKKKRERSALSRAAVSTIDYAHEIQRGVDGLASLHTVITENGSNKDTTFNCSICRENYSVLDDLFQCCSNVQCDTLVCRPCMLTYIDGLVHGSPYTMPPIKCCGCRQTIPTHIWRNALTYRCCEVKSPFLCYRDSIYAAVNAVNSKLRAAMAAHDEEEEDVITLASIFKLPDNFENLSADTALLHRIPSKVFAFQSSTSAVVEIEFMTDAEKTLHNNRVESLSNKCKILYHYEWPRKKLQCIQQ